MKFIIKRRDFSDDPVILDLDFNVERYSWDVIGGPTLAMVTAKGERDQLFELVNNMRAPIEILTDKGELVWWGYLAALDINTGMIQYGVDVDKMSNTVAVAFTNGILRYTTQWSADDDSVDEYGIKEMLLSRSDATEEDALQQRDTYLNGTKYPIPTVKYSGETAIEAIITCRGWYGTLEWCYYENLSGYEGYITGGRGGREVGEDDRSALAMSFQISSAAGWDATSIWLHIWRQGTNVPTDNLVVELKTDSGGTPGTTLATSSIVGSTVPVNAEWFEFILSVPVTLAPATSYWIQVQRSTYPTIDATAYYMIDTNLDKGYDKGTLMYYNTTLSIWQDASHKGDMLFKVMGAVDSTDQLVSIITACGQFFAGIIIEQKSGVNSTQYRNGDSTGLYEFNKLLLIGTTNLRRFLAEVTPNRYLRIYEEPVKPAIALNSYGLNSKVQLLFESGAPVDMELCLVGIWCHLKDVIPATIDLSVVADPSLFFIDAAEYDAVNKQYNILRTHHQTNLLEMGGVDQG